MTAQCARAGRLALAAALLAAAAWAFACIWWAGPPPDRNAPPATPAAVAVPDVAASPLPVAEAGAGQTGGATMPQVRIPPNSAGKDPFVAALAAARAVPPPPPPPAIAQAKTFEEAVAAMRAARGEAPSAAAAISPFGAR